MTDFGNSIIGNPKLWQKPDDVIRRELEMRDGITEYRRQRQQEEARRKGLAQAILTPEPAHPSRTLGETYALHAANGQSFYVDPAKPGHVMAWNAELGRHVPVSVVPGIYMPNDFPADDDHGS